MTGHTPEFGKAAHNGAIDGPSATLFRHRAPSLASSSVLDAPPKVDPDYKAVRVSNVRPDGFVEFDFIVGDPDIFAEMLLSSQSFAEFCAEQGVEPSFNDDFAAEESGLGTRLRDAVARAGHAPADAAQALFPKQDI